jgi:hypothetical protein
MLRNSLFGAALAIGIGLCAAASAAAAPLIVNGDFATGDFTGWTLTPSSANGTLGASPYPGISPPVTPSNPLAAPHAAVFNVGQITSTNLSDFQGGTLSQVFVLPGGAQIDFSAQLGVVNPVNATQSFAGLFEVLIDGSLEAQFDFGSIAALATETATLSFSDVLSAGPHTLAITILRPAQSLNVFDPETEADPSPRQYLANVVVAVPEPATRAILLAALLGLGIVRARARAQ